MVRVRVVFNLTVVINVIVFMYFIYYYLFALYINVVMLACMYGYKF